MQVSVSMDAALVERVKEFCTRTERTFSGAVRLGLERVLSDDVISSEVTT